MYSALLTNTTLDKVIELLMEMKDPYDFEGKVIYPALQVNKNRTTKETEVNVTGNYERDGYENSKITGAMNFSILPVGESQNVEVRVWWLSQASWNWAERDELSIKLKDAWQERWALNYLSKVGTKLKHTWEDLRFIPAQEESALVKLNISIDISSLEEALKEFSDAYTGNNVRHATFGRYLGWVFHRGEPIDRSGNKVNPERRCCWSMKLHLPFPKDAGVNEISFEAEAVKQLGKLPLVFTITKHGCQYPESKLFIDALLSYLNQVWDVEDVLQPTQKSTLTQAEHPITDGAAVSENGTPLSATENNGVAEKEMLANVAPTAQNTINADRVIDPDVEGSSLSEIERTIVRMFNEGFTVEPIAKKVGITTHSVENYKSALRRKHPGLLLTDRERRERGIKRRKDWLD